MPQASEPLANAMELEPEHIYEEATLKCTQSPAPLPRRVFGLTLPPTTGSGVVFVQQFRQLSSARHCHAGAHLHVNQRIRFTHVPCLRRQVLLKRTSHHCIAAGEHKLMIRP